MSALIRQVAVVSETARVSQLQLTQLASALQTQAMRDFGPLWQVQATVAAFATLDDVPVSHWPIIIEDNINTPDAAGVHLDSNNQPYALVQYDEQWTLTTSHECLEMLADPSGNRMQAASAPQGDPGGARPVQYLVEVCDPCEDAPFAYAINGVTVSDFITPHYYDTAGSSGVQYSFSGAIKGPQQVLQNGYLSYLDPSTGDWWQETYFSTQLAFQQLQGMGKSRLSLREQVDALTRANPAYLTARRNSLASLAAAAKPKGNGAITTQSGRAKRLRADIAAMMSAVGGLASG